MGGRRLRIKAAERDLMIIDTHAHYDDHAFDADREHVIAELYNKDIIAVNVGATFDSALTAFDLSQKYPHIYASIGVHPDEVGDLDEAGMSRLLGMANNEKVVAIGEIGLDYHWMVQPAEVQQKWFIRQIALAKEAGLPVNIHSREAAKDTYDIVKQENAGVNGGIVHCYSYSAEMARDYLKLGFHFGIGGTCTYKNARVVKEVVAGLPMEAIVLETDSPYLPPVPHRGERNDSRNLVYVAEAIGQIKGLTAEEVIDITYHNAKEVYPRLAV